MRDQDGKLLSWTSEEKNADEYKHRYTQRGFFVEISQEKIHELYKELDERTSKKHTLEEKV